MNVTVADLFDEAPYLNQPVTAYDSATGTYREFDLLVQRGDRMVLLRSADVHDSSDYQEWVRLQLSGETS
jgi:hypothetical protein